MNLRFKKIFSIQFFGMLVFSIFLSWKIWPNIPGGHVLSAFEKMLYDQKLRQAIPFRNRDTSSVAIVEIDEASLSHLGRWPWPRSKLAHLLKKLQSLGAIAVGFDMVFDEAQQNLLHQVISRFEEEKIKDPLEELKIQQWKHLFEDDEYFAKQLASGDSVLGFILDASKHQKGILPENIISLKNEETYMPHLEGYIGNTPILQNAARYGGFITTFPDRDGVIRRTPLVLRVGNKVYLSLAAEMVRLFLLAEETHLEEVTVGDRTMITALWMGGKRFPLESSSLMWVAYRGGARHVPYYSAWDVWRGEVPADAFQGKMVYLGLTALGYGELKGTPVSSVYPGVEVHATIAQSMLDDAMLVRPHFFLSIEILMTVIVGLFSVFVFPRLSPLPLAFLLCLMPVSIFFLGVYLLVRGFVFYTASSVILVVFLAMMNLFYGFFFENRKRFYIRKLFGQYVPDRHIEAILKDHHTPSLEGQQKEMTVLFCDIRNFTSISERMNASQIKDLLNRFLTPMTKIIFEHGGTIDKYVGDLIMAFWGAPLEDFHHAQHALEAAWSMQEHVNVLKEIFQKEGLPEISIGIGLNTGLMNVGDMGSEYRRAYTVLGDSVNFASRLEGLTKYYGVNILVGEKTKDSCPDAQFITVDKVVVKGKKDPVMIYAPVEKNKTMKKICFDFDRARALYEKRKFSEAKVIYQKIIEESKHAVAHIYLERIEAFEKNPPDDTWSGVYVFLEK